MLVTGRSRLVAAVMLVSAVVAGCGIGTGGPLELRAVSGFTADPIGKSMWFRVSGCLAQGRDPVDVMITGVTTSPASSHVSSRAAWNHVSPQVIGGTPGEPPRAYQPITSKAHTGSTLDGCSLELAVVLSPDTAPVVVRTVTVDYEIDGEAHSVRTTLDATLCPAGTHSGPGQCSDQERP